MALNSDIRMDAQTPLELEEPNVVPAPENPPSAHESQDAEDTEQIMQELRQTKAEQAVAQRRNRKLTLDKATFGITGVLALAFVAWGFLGRESLAATSTAALGWVMEYTGWLFMVLFKWGRKVVNRKIYLHYFIYAFQKSLKRDRF